MNKEIRKGLAKIAKTHLKDKVFKYEDDYIRIQYKIKSVVPDKTDNKYVDYELKLGIEVISLERKMLVKGENGLNVRGEDGRLIREFRRYVADKTFAHRNNHKLRFHAKTPTIFKALGIKGYDIKVGTIKWN